MILIPKARYRVLPRFEDCHHRTFRFFMLRSILYSPDVILPFSHSFLFATITSYASLTPRSGQAAYFSFLREPEGRRAAEAKCHDATAWPLEVFHGFVLRRLTALSLVPPSPFPARIFPRTDNKKCTRETHSIRTLTLTLR